MKIGDLIRKMLLAWLICVLWEYLRLDKTLRDLASLEGLKLISFPGLLLKAGCFCCALCFLPKRWAYAERWAIFGVFSLLAMVSLAASFSRGYLTVCILLLVLLGVYACFGWEAIPEPSHEIREERSVHRRGVLILSGLVFLLLSAWTVGRVYSFCSPTYDFGIFSQMFYNMRRTGLPMTTLERDGLLSHFAVHFSPIYYLMLPFFWLAPHPATLQVLQAAVVVSGVIPLWLLGRQKGLSGFQRMVLCFVLLLYPAYAGGVSYDLHENCFLTPLLLWLFYGVERKNPWITGISFLLTLTVKEDAAVYSAVFGLYLMIHSALRTGERWRLTAGCAMLTLSLGWFAAVTGYLASQGDGVMTYRYNNFIYDDSASLLTVVKAVVLNPMKAVYECVDPEKQEYIAVTLLPILGLPLMTRRYEQFLLLIPYVLVNLMSDYTYQHSIWFQYNFGPTAFLMYLVLLNVSDWKLDGRRSAALLLSAAICSGCFYSEILPTAIRYPKDAIENYEQHQQVRQLLSQIPEDASVCATTFHTTHLSDREILYDVGYASRSHLLESEYVVLDLTRTSPYSKYATQGQENGLKNLIDLLERNRYCLVKELPEVLIIYKAP